MRKIIEEEEKNPEDWEGDNEEQASLAVSIGVALVMTILVVLFLLAIIAQHGK